MDGYLFSTKMKFRQNSISDGAVIMFLGHENEKYEPIRAHIHLTERRNDICCVLETNPMTSFIEIS